MTQKRKRLFKIIGFSILGILVVPLLLAFVLLWSYQSEIIQYVKQEVRDQYGMNIDIKSSEIAIFSDWPNATLLLNEIDLRDTLDLFNDKPFLKAEETRLSFNLIPLLRKRIHLNTINIKKAKVQIWVDSTGQSNVSFLKKDSTTEASGLKDEKLKFENIKLSDFHFILMDAQKNRAIDINLSSMHVNAKNKNDKHLIDLNGDCLVNRLAFNTEKGDFIKGRHLEMKKWKGEVSNDFSFISFSQAKTSIDDHRFDLEIALERGGEGLLDLKVSTQKLDRVFALSLLTDKLQNKLAKFQWTGLIDVEADIKIPLKGVHDPTLLLTAKLENSDFKLEKNSLLLKEIQGLVTINIPGDIDFSGDLTNASLTAKIEKATFRNWPVTGEVLVENLKNPVLTTNASLNIPTTMLNAGQVNGPWSGTADALLNLQLPLDNVTAENWMERTSRFDVELKSSNIYYKVKNKKSLRLDLLANVNTKVLEIKRCNVSQDGQVLQVSGVVYDFMRKILNEEDYWKANVKLKSDHIILENWLDNIKQITEALPAKKPNASPTMDKQEMDNIVLDVDVKKLSYDNFIATRITGQLLIKPQTAEIKNLKLNTCKGTMEGDMVWKNSRQIKGNVKFKDAQVRDIFKSFREFNQDLVSAEQLEGIMNVDADFSLEIDSSFYVYQNSLAAVVDFSINNGSLKDFEPFEKISKYVFKNRNLDNIAFSDLKQRFRFTGTLMDIDLFEIKSTAFWIFLNGTYNFNGESDLRIQIPLKNLASIPEDAVYGEQVEDGRLAKSLFLKAVGYNDNISVSYDLSQGGKREERKEKRREARRGN